MAPYHAVDGLWASRRARTSVGLRKPRKRKGFKHPQQGACTFALGQDRHGAQGLRHIMRLASGIKDEWQVGAQQAGGKSIWRAIGQADIQHCGVVIDRGGHGAAHVVERADDLVACLFHPQSDDGGNQFVIFQEQYA